MTKDSPKAASLALRSICSAFSRCKSRVSDIEFETPLPVIIRCQNPQVEAQLLSEISNRSTVPIHPKLEPDNASVYVRPRNCPFDGGLFK